MTAAPVLAGDVDRDVWLAERRSGLGSSDVAAMLGISKWDGPLTVYASKVHGYGKTVTDVMELGNVLEPWIVAKFASRHPELVVTPKPGTFRGAKPWHIGTPDALARAADGSTVLVEAKTAALWGDDPEEGWGEAGTDEIPFHYLVQVIWLCRILRATRWFVPVLFDGRNYREYCGVYSPEQGDQIAERADAWWAAHVVAGAEPRADHLDSTRIYLNYRHVAKPKSTGQLPYEAAAWHAEYLDLRAQRADIETEMDLRKNLIRQAHVAGGFEVGQIENRTLTTLTVTKTGSKRLDFKEPK